MADYDGDGRTDLISGSSCCNFPPCFYLFRRQKDGGFGERRQVNLRVPDANWYLGGGNGLLSKVAVADWNGDGVADVIVGGHNTRHVGVAYGPLADKDELTVQRLWPKGEEPFQRITTNPCVADWDGDGLADLVVGGYREIGRESQGVYWLRNVGTIQEPNLAQPKLLIADEYRSYRASVPRQGRPGRLRRLIIDERRLDTTGICVADWNGDGRPDLIAGQKRRDKPRSAAAVGTAARSLMAGREDRGNEPKSAAWQHRIWVYLRQAR